MKKGIPISVILKIFVCCFVIILGVERNSSAADRSAVEDFVTRFYTLCLDREPDSVGLNGWISALLDGSQTGSDVAYGFVFSIEFINKNTTNEEYLTVLYEAFFNRKPDAAGMQGWLDAMTSGASRDDVLNGFIYATEFAELCEEYGIKAFEGQITKAQREAVEAFVTRYYQLCLDRGPDATGLEGWTNNLLNQIQTGADVANGFIYSLEFINKNTTNEKYLLILYKAFFNRDADQAGWDTWLAELNAGMDRDYVLNGFIYSQEFAKLCEAYGIIAFTEKPPVPEFQYVAGTWNVQEVINGNCEGESYPQTITDVYVITQTGNNLSITISSTGTNVNGTISGNKVNWKGTIPEGNGTLSVDFSGTVSSDGNTVTGTATGTWTDGSYTCSATTEITATQLSESSGNVSGTWNGNWHSSVYGLTGTFTANITQEGSTLGGTIDVPEIGMLNADLKGTSQGSTIIFGDIDDIITFNGTVGEGSTASGTYVYPSLSDNGTWQGEKEGGGLL